MVASDGDTPLVSVLCISYQHARFIRAALDGFLMQRTHFGVEILIHDDASTDDTQDIICEYHAKYPDRIRPILQSVNQMQQGRPVVPLLISAARGRYLAYCEGDDMWTDPLKLQTQVNYLESHPDYSMSAHAVESVDADGLPVRKARLWEAPPGTTFGFHDVLKGHFLPTLSLVFRAECVRELPPCYSVVLNGDVVLALLCTAHGPGHFDLRTRGAYRWHQGGITRRKRPAEEYWKSDHSLYEGMDAFTGGRFHAAIRRRLAIVDARYGIRMLASGHPVLGIASLVRAHSADPLVGLRLVAHRVLAPFR